MNEKKRRPLPLPLPGQPIRHGDKARPRKVEVYGPQGIGTISRSMMVRVKELASRWLLKGRIIVIKEFDGREAR